MAQYTDIQEMFTECITTLGFIYKKIQNASTFVFLRMSRSAWLFLIRNSKWRAMVVSPPRIATNLSTLSTSFLSLSLCDALKKKIRLQRIHFLSVLHVFVQLIYNIIINWIPFFEGEEHFSWLKLACSVSFCLNQSYNKILESGWLSLVRFEL